MASSSLTKNRSKKHRFRAFMAQPYKHPKSGIYYVRFKVPAELRQALGREYKRSLKTCDIGEARARYVTVLADYQNALALSRAQSGGGAAYSRADAEQLAARWCRDEQQRMDQAGTFARMLGQSGSTSVDTGQGYEEVLSYETLRALAVADPYVDWRGIVHGCIERGMRRQGLPVPPKDSSAYTALFMAFEEHVDKLSAWALERQYGEPAPRGEGVAPRMPIQAEQRAEATPEVHTLRDLFDKYSVRKTLDDGDTRATRKTLGEFKACIEDFIDLHGNLSVRDIGRELVSEHREAIARLPAQGKGIRSLTATQRVEKADKEHLRRLSAERIRNRLRALSAVLSHGVERGWLHENVVTESRVGKAAAKAAIRQKSRRRTWFTDSELKTIFASPAFSDAAWAPPRADFGEAWVWLPLLLYYTGARREELAQLATADVRCEAETGWYLSILEQREEDGDRTVKTDGSRRRIPLHPDLIHRGFVAYVQGLPPSGRLFPKLQPDAKGFYGANFGRRWAEYLRKTVKLASPASPVLGFRHTFKTLCRDVGIPEDVNDAMTGHVGENKVARGYGEMTLARMAQEIRQYPPVPMQPPKQQEAA